MSLSRTRFGGGGNYPRGGVNGGPDAGSERVETGRSYYSTDKADSHSALSPTQTALDFTYFSIVSIGNADQRGTGNFLLFSNVMTKTTSSQCFYFGRDDMV